MISGYQFCNAWRKEPRIPRLEGKSHFESDRETGQWGEMVGVLEA